jgi:UDP-N-acetylmuramoylalanine--D-glutamate ligase
MCASRSTIGVLGFGRTGRALCAFAVRHALPIRVSDSRPLPDVDQRWLRRHGIPFEHGGHTERFLLHADELVLSPGVPMASPVVLKAQHHGIPILSEVEFALRRIQRRAVIAVTGTNGKSTTVDVIAALVRAVGRRAWMAGNIGTPLISLEGRVEPSDVLVVEMSSYQLEQSLDLRTEVGVLLNLAPDHMARHGSMHAYAEAKGRLFERQVERDVAVLPRELEAQFRQGRGRRVFYDERCAELPVGAESLWPHDRANLCAALCACEAVYPEFDLSRLRMEDLIGAFALPHRMQSVGSVNDVQVIDDSKATNAAATEAALRSMRGPTVLLLGGRSKGVGYGALAEALQKVTLRHVVLFGEAASELEAIVSTAAPTVPFTMERSMEAALDAALHVSKPGDTLLFSPACASFDAFRDYADRGERFSERVRKTPGYRSVSPRA